VSATVPPTVILTSNSERNLGDALKRRCLHLHIVLSRAEARWSASWKAACPDLREARKQLVAFIHEIRTLT